MMHASATDIGRQTSMTLNGRDSAAVMPRTTLVCTAAPDGTEQDRAESRNDARHPTAGTGASGRGVVFVVLALYEITRPAASLLVLAPHD